MRPHRKQALDRERQSLATGLEQWLEGPMTVLGLVWLALLVVEFTRGLSPALELLGRAIWVVFAIEFTVRFAIAPRKGAFLKSNLLALISLALPAARGARIARVLRAGRGVRGVRLFRLVASLNRGLRSLTTVMGRRGLRYVVAATLVVAAAGAAGMYVFESNPGGPGLNDYGTALWWTVMLLTTMGSDYWPRTAEGRVLCVGLALYAFAVFGYLTAALASFFIARDASARNTEVAGSADMKMLREELRALRAELRSRAT
jgi:voltage-gated potassium channel